MIGGLMKNMEMFYIADNFKIDKPMYLEELHTYALVHSGVLDERNNVYSSNNTYDLQSYFNYLESVKTLSQTSNYGRYKHMLKLGFIPVLMVPSCFESTLHDAIIPRLEAQEIPYVKLPPMSFVKLSYTFKEPDIWVSKMDVYERLGCKPTEVTVRKLVESL